MSVLMSHSGARKLAAALRRTDPGLVRIGVRSGALYLDAKPDGGTWAEVWTEDPTLDAEPVAGSDTPLLALS